MAYKIKISYRTGDTFKTEDTEDVLELDFENVDIAKANLQRIKEHYQQYENLTSYSFSKNHTIWEIFSWNRNKDWFVYQPKLYRISDNCALDEIHKKEVGEGNWEYRPNDYHARYCINLKTDEGKDWQISAFWCGYFESLYSAEIITDNEGMKIQF